MTSYVVQLAKRTAYPKTGPVERELIFDIVSSFNIWYMLTVIVGTLLMYHGCVEYYLFSLVLNRICQTMMMFDTAVLVAMSV